MRGFIYPMPPIGVGEALFAKYFYILGPSRVNPNSLKFNGGVIYTWEDGLKKNWT